MDIGLPNVWISVCVDHLAVQLKQLISVDQPDEARKISQRLQSGKEILQAWVNDRGGSLIADWSDGLELGLEIAPQNLGEFYAVLATYRGCVNDSVSVGIGKQPSEAAKALEYAQTITNKIIFYDDEIGNKVAKMHLPGADLIKADAQNEGKDAGFDGHKGPSPHRSPSNASVASPAPTALPNHVIHEQKFRQLANMQESKDSKQRVEASGQTDDARSVVAEALQQFHDQLPAITQIKQIQPDAFNAITAVVQGLVALGRQVTGQGSPATQQKAQMEETEPDPTKPVAQGNVLDKGAMPESQHPTGHLKEMHLPPGTTHNGKMKVSHGDRTGWVGVRHGMVSGQEDEPAVIAQNGHPVSSLRPDAH